MARVCRVDNDGFNAFLTVWKELIRETLVLSTSLYWCLVGLDGCVFNLRLYDVAFVDQCTCILNECVKAWTKLSQSFSISTTYRCERLKMVSFFLSSWLFAWGCSPAAVKCLALRSVHTTAKNLMIHWRPSLRKKYFGIPCEQTEGSMRKFAAWIADVYVVGSAGVSLDYWSVITKQCWVWFDVCMCGSRLSMAMNSESRNSRRPWIKHFLLQRCLFCAQLSHSSATWKTTLAMYS